MKYRALSRWWLTLFASSIIGAAATLGLWMHVHAGHRAGAGLSIGLPSGSSSQTCASVPLPQIASLAVMASGHSPTELHAMGLNSAAAVVPTLDGIVSGPDPVAAQTSAPIVVSGDDPLGAIDADALKASGVVTEIAPLYGRSQNPTYRSCDYRLVGSPGALALLHVAGPAMVSAGLLTQAQLDAPSTIYMIGDDPFDADREYVTVVLEKPVPASASAQATPVASQYMTPVVALVEPSNDTVDKVGYANWYLGE